MPGIGRSLFSVKTALRKSITSSFDVNKPWLEAGDITVPLRGENSDLSFKLNLSADGYAGKELVINAVTNAQVWHRRLDHLNKRRPGRMHRKSGHGVAFDGFTAERLRGGETPPAGSPQEW